MTIDIVYDVKCQSDVFRISRASRLMGFNINPVLESQLSIVLSDGRVVFWSLLPPCGSQSFFKGDSKYSVLPNTQPTDKSFPLAENMSLGNIIPQLLTFGDLSERVKYHRPKFVLSGMLQGVGSHPVCAKTCPPLTTKNYVTYRSLAAVGRDSI